MGNVFYLSYAAILAALFINVLLIAGAPKAPKVLLLLVIAPLVYGNFICGIGSAIGEGALLKALNAPRFFFHVFATPLLFFIVYKLARGFKVPLAAKPAALWSIWILSAVLVAAGVAQELGSMQLVPKVEMGTLRYVHPAPTPPLGPIVANLVTIAAGALIWRRAGWPVLFITSLVMLLSAGIPPKLFGQIPGNAGEIVFMAGFMLALKRLRVLRPG
jgi:hypothetical protein